MKLFRNLTVVRRIQMMLAPPLVVAAGMAGLHLRDQSGRIEELSRLSQVSAVTAQLGDLVDQLQHERDITGVVLASRGGQLTKELPTQRKRTSDMLDELVRLDRAAFTETDSPMAAKLEAVNGEAVQLGMMRPRVDALAMPPAEAFARYTTLIGGLLDVMPEASGTAGDPAATHTFLALLNLMQAKEQAAQERALGAEGFATGRFDPNTQTRLRDLQAEQAIHFKLFLSYALDGQRQVFREALNDPAMTSFTKLRELARSDAPARLGGLDADTWLQGARSRIELLRDTELNLMRRLQTAVRQDLAAAKRAFRMHMIELGLFVVVAAALTTVLSRGLSRPIRRMTKTMTELASGNSEIEVPGIRGGEIGAMAEAVEVFRVNEVSRKATEAQVTHLERHDSLTQLPNRVWFQEKMRTALASASQRRNVAVLCLDLDNFKAVNDALGHLLGDDLLRAVGDRLQEHLGATIMVARLGGDEFAIMHFSPEQPGAVQALAEGLLAAIAEPFEVRGHSITVTTSIGIAVSPARDIGPHQLLRNADVALHYAKVDGRNRFRFFEDDMEARVQARRQIEADMREGLKENQFRLHFQPVVAPATSSILGFEALMRWTHPERGAIPPAQFIPVAEETGMINALGEWALKQACTEAVAWPEDVYVVVNMSQVQFRDDNLPTLVANALDASGLSPQRLELEVPEGALQTNAAGAIKLLGQLRELGVRISLDDFGTGYSSLGHLSAFPFDKLKVGRCFLAEKDNRENATIVRAIAVLGRSLGMQVAAKGVEDAEQVMRMEKYGYNEVQGFFFSPPRAPNEIPAMIFHSRRATGTHKASAPSA